MVFVNSSLLMTLGVCSVYDLRYRRIPAIVVAITTLYIAVALGVMGCLTPIRIVGAAVLCTFLELLCIASRDKIGTGDAIMIGMIQLALGMQQNMLVLLVTFSMVFITACILYMVCRVDKDLEIPLAPYLLVGVGVAMRWKGSYTVEAAFVIPIVLGVVFVLLYALFWVHDQCVLQANIQNGLIQYSDTGEELPTNEEWKRTLQQNLWMGNVTETAISHKRTVWRGQAKLESVWQNDLTAIFFADSQNSVYCLEWDEQQPSDIVRFRRKGESDDRD